MSCAVHFLWETKFSIYRKLFWVWIILSYFKASQTEAVKVWAVQSWSRFVFAVLQCQVNAETGDPEDELTPEAVELCRNLGSNATRVSNIAGGRDRTIHAAIQEGINRVNEKATSNAQRIQKWIVLERDFSVSGGELGQWERRVSCFLFGISSVFNRIGSIRTGVSIVGPRGPESCVLNQEEN